MFDVLHGDDDQIVPRAAAGRLPATMLRNCTLMIYRFNEFLMKKPARKPVAPTQAEAPSLATHLRDVPILFTLHGLAVKRFPAGAVHVA